MSGGAESELRLVAPLVSGRRIVGVLDLEWDEPVTPDDADRGYLEALAGQAGQALDRARHIEAERSVAETLQRSVLPDSLPSVPGVQLAARYLPGTHDLAVGGDWFDAVELADARLGLVVGDVVGKGVHAAAKMGQLRNALRAFSVERLKPPSALQRLDRLVDNGLESSFATVIYGVIDLDSGVLRYASAGHPPPVVASPDGRVVALEDGRGLPLGTGLRPKYRQGVVELPPGSVLVLYSDGLVERRRRSIDEGIAALCDALGDGPTDVAPLLEHVLERLLGTEERGDDVAIIAARVGPVAPRPLDMRVASATRSLPLIRGVLRAWLEGVPLERTATEELLLATWEICANAIEHADDPLAEQVRVHARVGGDRLEIVVEDSGTYVPARDRLDRGLGLKLAGALATTLEITPSPRGTRVTLARTLG
jgi:anti-sigma regulatory factor (Ser/Thr protein kinase)